MRVCRGAVVLAVPLLTVAAAAPSAAQNSPQPLAIGALPAAVLRELPSGGNVFALLETTQPEAVTDRFTSGGLSAGAPARAGAFLASWSQTHYRIGDVEISSPLDGSPLLFPEIAWWERIDVATGPRQPAVTAPGLSVSLHPGRAPSRWSGVFEGSGSGSGLVAGPSPSSAPAIARLRGWGHASALVSGPALDGRMGLTVGGAWSQSSAFERDSPSAAEQDVRSLFAHASVGISAGRELRALVWTQSARAPFTLATLYRQPDASTAYRSLHVQSTFDRKPQRGTAWQVTGAYTRRSRSDDATPVAGFELDRLVDGPVPFVVDDGDGAERRWLIDTRVTPSWRRGPHAVELGAAVEGIGASARPPFAGAIAEWVDRYPARTWIYGNPGVESSRRATMATAVAHDRLSWPSGVTLDAALRFESVDGRARGAAEGVSWRTWLPSARLHWDIGTALGLGFDIGGGRSAAALRLGLLAWGDPAAPAAEVWRWDGPLALPQERTLIARVGPGTAGDPSFSAIDPDLKRPVTDEFTIGLEARPRPSLRLAVAGVARRQSSLINAVNTGVDASGYTTFTIPDANVDLAGAGDDQQLIVYNRRPESFGRDRYLLTNPGQDAATMAGLVVSARIATDRLFMWIAGTASTASGSGGNRGFRAIENDQDVPGELATNPNAATYARGRLFTDRAYTIKWTTVYRLPRDISLGAIARYQDGQPFARMVVVPALNQGAEAIQAFANGRSRFAFTGTLDVRLRKGFRAGAARIDAIVDAYNLLNMTKEVEEYVVTGPRFREITAIQPPRAIHLGARLSF